jgi:hypothetical protein
MVWRAPGQVRASLTRPDLSCGATFLPEDPTLAPLVLSSLRGTEGSNPSPSSGESVANFRRVPSRFVLECACCQSGKSLGRRQILNVLIGSRS